MTHSPRLVDVQSQCFFHNTSYPLLPLYNAQWRGYESLTALVLVICWKPFWIQGQVDNDLWPLNLKILSYWLESLWQAVNWFLYSYKTPIFWVRILYSEKPPIFPIFSYILNIIPIFFSELVAALPKTLLFLFFWLASFALKIKLTFLLFQHESHMHKNYLLV